MMTSAIGMTHCEPTILIMLKRAMLSVKQDGSGKQQGLYERLIKLYERLIEIWQENLTVLTLRCEPGLVGELSETCGADGVDYVVTGKNFILILIRILNWYPLVTLNGYSVQVDARWMLQENWFYVFRNYFGYFSTQVTSLKCNEHLLLRKRSTIRTVGSREVHTLKGLQWWHWKENRKATSDSPIEKRRYREKNSIKNSQNVCHVLTQENVLPRSQPLNRQRFISPQNTPGKLSGHADHLFTRTVDGFHSIYRCSKLIVILSLLVLLNTSQCCEQSCYSAYKDGSLDLQEVQDGSPTIVPINFTGVVTIEAAYIPGYKAQWEYIRFKKNKDHEPLVMQFYTPNEKYTTTLTIFGEDEIGVYPDSRYSVYSLFDNITDNIIVQVSDVHVTEDNFYRIYLGEPGKAHSSNYSYQSKDNWDELSFMRFNTTTQIKTDNKAIYFKSVSVCSDDTPVLCGESVETVAVSGGEAFNLSCPVYGAPYLEAVWSNVTTGDISEQPVHSVDGFLQTTTISVGSFNGNHVGEWKCYWRNKNLGTLSRAKVFHVVELVSKPSQTTYVIQKKSGNQVFQWVIKNKLSEENREKYDTLLDCKEDNSTTMESRYVQYEENSAVSEHSATLILPETITSDNITCTLYLVVKSGEHGTERLGVLDTTTLFREGYHCEAGYYGVGEECVECAGNFTSPPRSVTCTPEVRDTISEETDTSPGTGTILLILLITGTVLVFLAIVITLMLILNISIRKIVKIWGGYSIANENSAIPTI